MAIEKLEAVDITCYIEDLNEVLKKCCQSGCFHIEPPDSSKGDKFKLLNEENPYENIITELSSFFSKVGIKYEEKNFDSIKEESAAELSVIADEIKSDILKNIEHTEELSEDIKHRRQVAMYLSHLEGIDEDYQKLFSCKNVSVRFGKFPIESYEKLSYHKDKPFIFNTYDNDGEYYWGMYLSPSSMKDEIDDIFSELYFERIRLPDFVEGTGKDAKINNEKVILSEREELKTLKKQIDESIDKNKEKLNMIYSKLVYLSGMFELRREVALYDDKYILIKGYVPSKNSKEFTSQFKELDTVSVISRPCERDNRLNPPTKLKNNIFAEPFSMFVEMYGLPSHNGFDPTMLVAITYTLLFGLMFADLGQGIIIAIAGAFLWHAKKNKLGAILERVGISSAVFGFIFGSVFGFEHLLDPVFRKMGFEEKPFEVMDNINTILYGAIALGVVFIIITIIINICIGFKQKDYERALFSNNGIAGLVFFVAILGGLVGNLLLGMNLLTPIYVVFLIVIPALLMFFREILGCLLMKKPIEKVGIGDFIASNFFEVFEFGLGFATNTLSFVRVGGFILSHAGMMSVVMLLAEMAGKSGSILVIILGNIFVIGMEGLIVGIQSLRLEFYEVFSRFYDGDGRAFEPVNMKIKNINSK